MIGMYAFAYPNMIVEHYTAERGLPNNIVNCTLKGQDGFIWFGTWYGLCSFDGSKFRSYDNHDGFYSTDIPPRKIQRIVEDKNGFLWIKTIDRKLYLFDKRHESFHAVYDDVKEYSENIQIIKIQTTEDGDVLLLTKDKSLLRAYTDKEGKITMKQLHDSRPNVNVYDMRLKHNIFCETAEFIDIVLVCSFVGGNVHQTGFRYQQIRNRLFDFRYLVTVDNSVLRINAINMPFLVSQP